MVKDDKSDAMKKIDFNHQKLSYMQGKIMDVQKKINGLEVIKEE